MDDPLSVADSELIDVITAKSHKAPVLELLPYTTHVLYIERECYEADVRSSMPTERDVYRQLRIDAPRCQMRIDGVDASDTAAFALSAHSARFCTQAASSQPHSRIASRMRVRTSTTGAHVRRRLGGTTHMDKQTPRHTHFGWP